MEESLKIYIRTLLDASLLLTQTPDECIHLFENLIKVSFTFTDKPLETPCK